jgi:hypothetical protein
VNTSLSARTQRFLSSQERPSQGDAVLYLMRHLHGNDVRFLEAFHDQVASRPGVVNAVGVLSRADELGVGRLDAMRSADRIALRYRQDPRLRQLCQTIVPFAGLLAETATTLREDEFGALSNLAMLDQEQLDTLLLSADRFVGHSELTELGPAHRAELLERFGIFGIRISCDLLRTGAVKTSTEMSRSLRTHSGLDQLREVLRTQFAHRSNVLRARSGVLAFKRLLRSLPERSICLERELERFTATTHEFAEIEVLAVLRSPESALCELDRSEAERLLGGFGTLGHQRLGVGSTATSEELIDAARTHHARWQRLAENPAMPLPTTKAARVLVRTCEGLFETALALGVTPKPASQPHENANDQRAPYV